ncbi:tryptophan synthase subunit alpha [Salmonella enterica subsp. salamae]|uniref:Tryptophan synthase alpha chain n=1 Tax=Salmonella enterica subsp. salamae TaxID=59202 RepID=A0A6D2G713_SALER|nr:tryptophan synthase subunit alpha [Salmonella enterica subsp. salamae]
MERYENLFAQLNDRREGAFVPFVTLGDPGIEQSLKIIDTLIDAGADALELGIPFSDPLADGPTIQNANLRAFAAGVTPAQCFEMLALIREKHPTIPIGLLMYANLVFTNGIDAFYARCEQVGVDSVLVADVPVEESAPFRQAALRHNIAPIFICPPNADDDLLRQIASYVAVIPTCFPVRASPARKTVAHCRCIISLRSLKSTMPRLRYRASVSPRRNRCLRPCVPGRLALSPAQPLSTLSRKTRRLPNRCWRNSGPLSQP